MALILKRKIGEAIEVNGPAVITLLKNQKLSIVAPKSTHILRTELKGKPAKHTAGTATPG